MLEKIVSIDTNLFIYLNSLGSERFDWIWLLITKQVNWIPFFLLLFYVIYKKIGLKQSLYILLFIALLVAFTDQITNLVKNNVQRLRPCNNPEINAIIRVVKQSNTFSFFSGHSSNTMAVTVFLLLALGKRFKYAGFLFFWPLIFAYSRIYLGLHYPLDICCGYLFGATMAFLFNEIYKIMQEKYFSIHN
jgi:undecaprenyl-diphosphatase